MTKSKFYWDIKAAVDEAIADIRELEAEKQKLENEMKSSKFQQSYIKKEMLPMIEGKKRAIETRKAAANATAEIDGSVHAKAKNQPGESFARLIPAVIFIGGFLFHLFWEAKSQYTAFYVLLLIPDAVRGIKKAGKQSKALFQHRSSQPHGGHRN